MATPRIEPEGCSLRVRMLRRLCFQTAIFNFAEFILRSNFLIYSASHFLTFPDVLTVPWTPASGIKVLGAPVCFPGCTVYQQTVWQGANKHLQLAADRVTQLTDAQLAHHVLRVCWMRVK